MAQRQRRLQAVSTKEYPLNPEHTIPQRAAHFLDWYANEAPGRYITYPDLMKVVYGIKRRPIEDSRDVAMFKSKMGGIKRHLRISYARAVQFHPKPGGGFRASTDADDLIENDLAKKVRRVNSAHASLVQTQEIIDPATIRKEENKSFFRRTVQARALLQAENLLKKLALPAKPEEEP